jgi:hypothetical protein
MGYLFRRAQMKGLLGGSRPWLYLWLTLAGFRLLRRITRDKPEILYSEELKDGDALVVSARS